MPLDSKIWLFTKSIVGMERDDYGVYEVLNVSDNILYIGYGKIRSSLMRHFADGQEPIDGAFNFRVEYTWDEEKSEKRGGQELSKYFETYKNYPEFNK